MPGGPQTLPGSSNSHRVTGLEPGVPYVFSLTPIQSGVRGSEITVTQKPGMEGTVEKPEGTVKWPMTLVTQFFCAACPHGQVDVVFLLHATRDNAHNAEAVKRFLERLVSALGPLGPQAVQVWL